MAVWLPVFLAFLAIISVFKIIPGLVTFWKTYRKTAATLDQFDGPPKHWLFGCLDTFPGYNEAGTLWFLDIMHKYKTSARLWFGPFHGFLFVFHPDTVKVILSSSQPKELGGPIPVYRLLDKWLGRGLLSTSGHNDNWFHNRKLLTHGFHFGVLKPYVNVYDESADKLVEIFASKAGPGSINICKYVWPCTLEIMLKCALAYPGNLQQESLSGGNAYIQAISQMGKLVMDRFTNPLLYSDFVYSLTPSGRRFQKLCNQVHEFAENIIKRRKADRDSGKGVDKSKRYKDFLDILLEAKDETGQGLTDREIRDEVDTFMFAGHDTTASSITWCIYCLAQNQEDQAKAREEVDAILDERESDSFEWDDLSRLQYLHRCIKESGRVQTTVPVIGRTLSKDMVIDGKTVAAGTLVNTFMFGLHRNPDVWGEDVEEFKPERFLPENRTGADPFSYTPFSAGPRNCIGQNFAINEIKVVVGKLLRRFTFEVDTTRKVGRKFTLVLESEDGIWIHVTPRKNMER